MRKKKTFFNECTIDSLYKHLLCVKKEKFGIFSNFFKENFKSS